MKKKKNIIESNTEKRPKITVKITTKKKPSNKIQVVSKIQWINELQKSPNPPSINNRNTKSKIFSLYKHGFINWDDIYFERSSLKTLSDLRFAIKIAKSSWTQLVPQMKKIYKKGLEVYFTEVNGVQKIFTILNLDILLGVALGILDPDLNDYSRISIERIDENEIEKIITSSPWYKSRKPYINHLMNIRSADFQIYIVKESVDYHNLIPKIRTSFLFTIKKMNETSGFFVLESLEENTATHIFKILSFDNYGYEISKARLRNYFQGRLTNKRQRLYDPLFVSNYELDKISTLHHTDFENWKSNLTLRTKK